MAFLTLFFDTVNKHLVRSETNPGQFVLPEITQEDALDIELTPLKRISYVSAPFFQRHLTSGLALEISVGTAGVKNATQATWSEINNGATFSGSVDLDTAGIGALADGASQKFEIMLTGANGKYRGIFNVVYRKSVNLSASLNPVVNDTALGRLEAARRFVPQVMAPGQSIQWTTESGRTFLMYFSNDGVMQTPEMT